MRAFVTSGLLACLSLSTFSVLAAEDPAALTAKVTLSNLQYTLTDLNTRDLIKPSVKNEGGSVNLQASGFGTPGQSTLTATPFDAVNGTVTGPIGYFPVATSTASKAGNTVGGEVKLTSDQIFNIGGLSTLNQPYAAMGTRGSVDSTTIWLLSPGTQIVVSGLANIDVGINTQAIAQAVSATSPNVSLEALGSYNLSLVANNMTVDSAAGQLTATLQSSATGPVASDIVSNSLSKAFSLTLQNTGTQSIEFRLYLNAFTEGSISRAGLVPEPSTYALMALGLGLMAWRVRAVRRA